MITVREEIMSPAMTKFHLDGLPFGAVLHRFTEPDRGDPHDHPWGFRSTILMGGYIERVHGQGDSRWTPIIRSAGDSFFVPMSHIHRIIEVPFGECWTLIQPKPEYGTQKSGFYRWVDGVRQHRFWDGDWA